MFNLKVQVDLLLSGGIIAVRAMDMLSKYSLLLPGQCENPQEFWGSFRFGRLGILSPPKSIQMGEGGEWRNETWADLRAGRRIKLQFPGVEAYPS